MDSNQVFRNDLFRYKDKVIQARINAINAKYLEIFWSTTFTNALNTTPTVSILFVKNSKDITVHLPETIVNLGGGLDPFFVSDALVPAQFPGTNAAELVRTMDTSEQVGLVNIRGFQNVMEIYAYIDGTTSYAGAGDVGWRETVFAYKSSI